MSCMPTNLAFHPAVASAVASGPGAAEPATRRRPKLLIRAAEAGQAGWRRERDLPRLLGQAAIPGTAVVMRLLDAEEAFLNEARRARAPEYSIERHVLVLIALLAELRSSAARGAAPAATPGGMGQVVPFTGPGTSRRARP